jgi:hypothetical protein
MPKPRKINYTKMEFRLNFSLGIIFFNGISNYGIKWKSKCRVLEQGSIKINTKSHISVVFFLI